MRRLRAWSVPKRFDAPSENEDAFAVNAEATCFAVCDGATESFASGRWARGLAASFVRHPPLDRTSLAGARHDYERSFDQRKWPPYRRNAYRRGSYAAFAGLMIWPRERLYAVQAVGDSICVLADGADVVSAFPIDDPHQFDQRPVLLSTNDHANLVDGVHLLGRAAVWSLGRYSLHRRAAFYLMTDALGAWFLTDPVAAIGRLQAIETEEAFAALVVAERAAGRMRRDDTTAVIVELGSSR
jgi:serine/threonine protein phosphatase PrpC